MNWIPHRTLQRLRHILSDSVTSCRDVKSKARIVHTGIPCRIPLIWKASIGIPIPKPGQDSFFQHFLSAYLAPLSSRESFRGSLTSNRQQSAASIRRTTRFPTRTLFHFCFATIDEWYRDRFQPKEPPHRTECVAVDLTAVFDTVNHNVLLSKIVRSALPGATCRWLSNYLRSRQSVTSCRDVNSKARIVHTGVPQGSKRSPTLFSFFISLICYGRQNHSSGSVMRTT